MLRLLRRLSLALVGVLACANTPEAFAKIPRSSALVAQFKKQNPCPGVLVGTSCRDPKTGKVLEVDHAIARCMGGPDALWNLQWQWPDSAKLKDDAEKFICAKLRAAGLKPEDLLAP